MNSEPSHAAMDRPANAGDELRMLRILCSEAASREQRIELLQSLQSHRFSDPDYQVVFESARFLLSRGPVSATRLAVHLNNRGFPDIALGKYFSGASPNGPALENADKDKA